MFKKISLVLVLLFFTISLSACSISWPWQNEKPNKENIVNNNEIIEDQKEDINNNEEKIEFKKITNYDDYKLFVKENVKKVPNSSGHYYNTDQASNSSLSLSDMASSESYSAYSSAGSNYSETNVQVKGVDEADVIKTDGKHIFIISKNNLFIINALPASDSEIITTIEFESRPSEMYINNNRLAVLGNNTNASDYDFLEPESTSAFVDIFDITNIEEPKKIKNYIFEGSYFNSRKVAGKMYLILNQTINISDEENLLPLLIEDGEVVSSDCSQSDKCYFPEINYLEYEDYSTFSHKLINISSIDLLNNGEITSSKSFLTPDYTIVYSSAKNIYITSTVNGNYEFLVMEKMIPYFEGVISDEDFQKLNEIKNDNEISDNDKVNKYSEILINYDINEPEELFGSNSKEKYQDIVMNAVQYLYKTDIFKFSLNDGSLNFENYSSVPGYITNQFFLDEDENENLRIVTTQIKILNYDDEYSYYDFDYTLSSNLFVLSPDLKILGSVRDLADDEEVYSVRFLGKRAYIVTFEIIDPLFVIDLTNPYEPVLMGELKIPGYSNYLHPYDENTLIGFGRESDSDSLNDGLKLSLFDVKDPSSPNELDNFIIGNSRSDSLALYNHKAFLFDKEKNILVLPAFLSGYLEDGSSMGGAMVLSIDNNKFNLKGVIDHSDNGIASERDYFCGESCYDNSVQRSLYINDVLYTFSNKYLKANNINDLEELNTVSLIDDETEALKRDRKRLSDIKEIRRALEMYYSYEGSYPEEESISTGASIITQNNMIFLDAYPSPPIPIDGDSCKTALKGSQEYTYELNDSQSYSIHFCLGSDIDGISAGYHTMTPYGIE